MSCDGHWSLSHGGQTGEELVMWWPGEGAIPCVLSRVSGGSLEREYNCIVSHWQPGGISTLPCTIFSL